MKRTQKRRRREGKTDYLKRINLLKGKTPRIVFRKTNKYIIAQYVESKEAKDKIVFSVTSKHLLKEGWPKEMSGSLKSISAAYFTGLLTGAKIKANKLKTPILDTGMVRSLGKTKVFGFIKGLIDAEIKINCKEENFPEKDRIKGKALQDKGFDFEKIKSKISKNG